MKTWNVTGFFPFWFIYLIPKAKETPKLSKKSTNKRSEKINRMLEVTEE